jgi:HAD superfamily hydrolase (TIGR01509 family)
MAEGDNGDNGVRAVLWDMDGTLVDTARFHLQAWRETLADLGIAVSHERFMLTFGRRNDAVIRDLVDPDATSAEIARIADLKEMRYRDLIRAHGVEPLPGFRDWLPRLRAAGLRNAIASSAPHANIDAIVDAMGFHGVFDGRAGDEDVTVGKPDPQVFFAAAASVGADPARCVVVEDAPAGVEGGRRAGMRTVGVRSGHGALDADLVVDSLADLPADAFERLLAAGPIR